MDEFRITATRADGTTQTWSRGTLTGAMVLAVAVVFPGPHQRFVKSEVIYAGRESNVLYRVTLDGNGVKREPLCAPARHIVNVMENRP